MIDSTEEGRVQSVIRNLKRANSCDSPSPSQSLISFDSGTSPGSEGGTSVFRHQFSFESDSYCDPEDFFSEIVSMSGTNDSAVSLEPPTKVPCSVSPQLQTSEGSERADEESNPSDSGVGHVLPVSDEATTGKNTRTKELEFMELHTVLRTLIREVSTASDREEKIEASTSGGTQNSGFCKQSSYHTPTTVLKSPRALQQDTCTKTHLLYNTYLSSSMDGQYELKILKQPEQQHRARYLTEGSRGAVKDQNGTGYPVIKLFGYKQPVTVHVFIGTDQGKIFPHLFYQASKVLGKYSTSCLETKIEGTNVLEIEMTPQKDMTVICDCLGILKERNADVEHRLTLLGGTCRSKRRTTRCRFIFCVQIPKSDGTFETLQEASSSIICSKGFYIF
ncbi:nuclear factor of activated T-cells, cytoplasmic 1-like [Limulus polyphemus]|uniref:Nuclear factor of activated T-cells, cytoplasmic 1-like n=1 Tax=Limulus polyphemus TaxID=6850 RepID=A0ABM1RZA5_LIMPO|nr:nuclear factor of activated T-cells, cytoplasmic 1-like [Limulus polyphemus]